MSNPIRQWGGVDNMQENKVIEKFELITPKLKDFPDLFNLREQKNKDVVQYFERFKCRYLPTDFISFMSILDGLNTEIFTIFSIGDSENQIDMKYEDYSTEEKIADYLNALNLRTTAKLFFFAADNIGGRYAFKTNIQDDSVYYINASSSNMVVVYDSFLDLVNDKINEYISKKI